MNKNQQNQENTELYRRLRGEFEMTPEQMQRVRQKILQRTSEQNAAPVMSVNRGSSSGSGLFVKRLIPAAACMLIAVGGIFLHFRLSDPLDSFTQQSSVLLEEQTARIEETGTTCIETAFTSVTQTKTTLQMTTDQTAESHTEQTVTELNDQTSETQTEAVTTENTDAEQPQDQTKPVSAIPKTEPGISSESTEKTTAKTTAKSTASLTTTVQTTVTAAQTTTEQPVQKKNIAVQNVVGEAGQTVKVDIVLNDSLEAAGIQLSIELICRVDDPEPILVGHSFCPQLPEDGVSWAECSMNVTMAYATYQNISFAEDTSIVTLEYLIPEDAVSGSVYKIYLDNTIFATKYSNKIPLELYAGSITVA